MHKVLSALLFKDNNPNATRSIYVEIKNGFVVFTQQDIGSLCEKMFENSEHERIIFDLPVELLRSALGVKTDKELLAVLKREYNTSDAFDRFSLFVYNLHLKCNYFSW